MKSHCHSFRQIPHSTRLFLDFLDFTPPVQALYPRSPRFLEWAKDEGPRISYPAERRNQVADILSRQNQAFGASAKTLANIERFRSGACAIVTGQQVGLFGGPVFSIYKALTAVKLAQQAAKLAIDCVPVFWLATEDHDLAEVNQVRIPGPDGLQTLAIAVQSKPDAPVGTINFGEAISEPVARAQELLGDPEIAHLLGETYQPGETFGTAFARLFVRLFADFGVILLDGSDPELDQIAAPLYKAAIEHASKLTRELLKRDAQLQAAGYHPQVHITDSSTLLFAMRDGARVTIHAGAGGGFLVGEEKVPASNLIGLAELSPQSFSPNVLLRPVVQDYLLPTLAYVGGSAEVAYFAQCGAVYEDLLGRVTPIVPRFSATLNDAKTQDLLERYQLSPLEIFEGPEKLRETMGARKLPPNLQNSFEQATAAVESSMKVVRDSLAQLDKTLVESAEHATSKMVYQITNLRARAARAELRQSEVVGRHADVLSGALYPDKTLQEREYAGVYFLAKHGKRLMDQLLETIHPDCLNHQVIEL